jgi:hypothetical protein
MESRWQNTQRLFAGHSGPQINQPCFRGRVRIPWPPFDLIEHHTKVIGPTDGLPVTARLHPD